MVLLGRNCSQGKLKLMMLLQAAMIVKSLPKYMYMCSVGLEAVRQWFANTSLELDGN